MPHSCSRERERERESRLTEGRLARAHAVQKRANLMEVRFLYSEEYFPHTPIRLYSMLERYVLLLEKNPTREIALVYYYVVRVRVARLCGQLRLYSIDVWRLDLSLSLLLLLNHG